MTFNEFILKYENKLTKINTKLDGNHIITKDDIENEIICNKYDWNSFNVFSNSGLMYDSEKVIFLKNSIDRIEISSDVDKIDCHGGVVKIECFAVVNVYDGNEIYKTFKHKINPVYSFDGCTFNYGTNLVEILENKEYVSKQIIINAKYGYCGVIYKASLCIIQSGNYDSDWINSTNETTSINIIPSKNNISSHGGYINVMIQKESVNSYYKKDCFGNITRTKKSSPELTDVTNECIITVNEPFNVTDTNKIIFPPQEINSEFRTANITCKYDNIIKTITINQDKGPVVSYIDFFSFDDNTINKKINLKNSATQSINVKLISNRTRFLDGIKYDKIDNSNIDIEYDNNWLSCDIDKEKLLLSINVLKNDLESDRECNITLQCNNKKINILLIQPSKKEIKCEYEVLIVSEDEMFINELNDKKIEYKPIKKIYYDDGSYDILEYLNPFFKLEFLNDITDENIILTTPKLVNFNGLYVSLIKYKKNYKFGDININLSCRILDNNLAQVGEVSNKHIVIHNPEPKTKNIEITITVNSDTNKNISSINESKFRILDSYNNCVMERKIGRFWVNENMKNDIVYYGNVILYENEKYHFYVDSYEYENSYTEKLHEEYIIENDDIGIDLVIKI